jgi:acyl transferase domain-containing protein
MINFEGGFLSEKIDVLDADFFGISHREAASIDPQQRILMEIIWEALEDGGLPADQFSGAPVGVYVGGFTTDSLLAHFDAKNRDYISSHSATSSTLGMLANRISYLFDFRGPSLTIDTACSSSLVALNYACRDLWSGECSIALAAGVNIMMRPEFRIAMTKGGFLAQNSRSKAFSADADGYGRGEGGGVVVLKRLSEAQADGDRIYAIIRGIGVNQDGRTPGITVPNADAQKQLIKRVYSDFGIDPADVGYVEAHGTGTPVGDPIEMQALGAAIGAGLKTMSACTVGSVKANIGHQEAAAGIASTIKAALVLAKRQVPPQIKNYCQIWCLRFSGHAAT